MNAQCEESSLGNRTVRLSGQVSDLSNTANVPSNEECSSITTSAHMLDVAKMNLSHSLHTSRSFWRERSKFPWW